MSEALALVIEDKGPTLGQVSLPPPASDQVLIEVLGAGLNRADLLQLRGGYPSPRGWPPQVPGLEIAGRVEAVGPSVASFAPGDLVMGIVGGGGQASRVLTREGLLVKLPPGSDPVLMGGVPEAFITAHDALATQAHLRPQERVLIHSVGSGVGTAAVQVAKALGAGEVVGTSRNPEKLERARSLGMDRGVLGQAGMAGAIGEVDVIVELVGGDYIETDLQVLSSKGRLVLIGLVRGSEAKADLGAILSKRLSIVGTVMRGRKEWEREEATSLFEAEMLPLFASGRLRPVVEEVVPAEDFARAYELLASNQVFGKIVLQFGGRK